MAREDILITFNLNDEDENRIIQALSPYARLNKRAAIIKMILRDNIGILEDQATLGNLSVKRKKHHRLKPAEASKEGGPLGSEESDNAASSGHSRRSPEAASFVPQAEYKTKAVNHDEATSVDVPSPSPPPEEAQSNDALGPEQSSAEDQGGQSPKTVMPDIARNIVSLIHR